jgi:tRNA modification GTPase
MNGPAVYGDTVPIAAIATAVGESALTLIRTSGEHCLEMLGDIFSRPEKLLKAAENTIVHGWIIGVGGKKIDEVLISVYRSPRSYTGEDGADISCHGGIAAAKAVMEALRGRGFRNSLPGEFSFRAFMNGKLDLTRAESVMEIVSAKTGLAREHAVHRLSGALEKEIRGINTIIVQALGASEILLDYSEDDGIGPENNSETDAAEAAGLLPDRPLVEEALGRLKTLAASYRRERLYAEGALGVIAGRPNAGKSSLFNMLLNEDRSIVTDIPGTTRDWIEAWVSIEGIPVRLTDTAGIHPSEDPVEKLGMERSRQLLAEADLILYVIDGTEGITPEDRDFLRDYRTSVCGTGEGNPMMNTPRVILIWNKTDLAFPPSSQFFPAAPILPVSAKTGAGIPGLTRKMAEVLEEHFGGDREGNPGNPAGIGTARQKELVDRAVAALEETLVLADRPEPLDLIAPLLREGVNALGEITGEVSTAEILDTMFSRFCVGK